MLSYFHQYGCFWKVLPENICLKYIWDKNLKKKLYLVLMLVGLTHSDVPVTTLRKKAGLVFHPLGFDVKTQRTCMT